MKRIVTLAGALLLSVSIFAAKQKNPSDELTNIIGNYYRNDSMSLNVKDSNSKSEKSSRTVKSGIRDQIIEFASNKLGAPYVWGATGPNSFDCSGFVGYVFKKAADLSLPRVSSAQATFRPKISSMNMKKGDLVFFETTGKGRISHVGIYMGNRQFIHASSGSRRVTVSSLDSNYYSRTFRWAINPFS
ncbi:peptidoglycan endopeptidase [Leptotrichia sp. OH3620_COT-345]|uniref:C40 family peptidase n=1 Tax=Leptotrichia sp. OH3620_COT-345 TaxID=2491048 RepID=UPI000F64C1C5|nr:C40 family peptidase [Leptotrichia sp. OH3620_COT-345]RRD40989.1 peptidoglycan endopeptidase [Leptotrichia sp. OH3620_COT-345]